MYKNSSGNLKQKEIGCNLSGLAIGLCGHPDLERVFLEMQFTPVEVYRFRFCLLFHNIASAVWCVNTLSYILDIDKTLIPRILDEMLEDVIDSLKKDESKIKIGDFVVDQEELEFLSKQCEIGSITMTTYYTLFLYLYERHANRVDQYLKALTERIETHQKSKNNNKHFSLDPVTKLFVRHFKGGDWKNDLKLFFTLSNILISFHGQIMNYVGEKIDVAK